jgi:hypothetical protein
MPHLGGKFVLCAYLASVLVACGEEPPGFDVRGARVVVETGAPFAHHPDFPGRMESTLDVALRYWGGAWANLAGRSITLVDAQYVSCGEASALGCYDGDIRFTTRDPSIGTFDCVEQTILVHEVGHAVIGDRQHQDPRWMEFDPVHAALSGRTGYGAAGEVDCVLFASVWRHVLGAP